MQKSKLHDFGIEGNRICTIYLLLLLFENFFSFYEKDTKNWRNPPQGFYIT